MQPLSFNLNKRGKIITATLILTISILFATRLGNFIFLKERLIILVGVLAYILSAWALWEDLTKTKAVMLMILPTLFTIAVVSVYFLIPVRPPKLLWAFGFGLSFYLLLLSQNVFNVASIRTIPLYRVAQTASFIFTIFTAFILFNVVFAFNLPFYWNGIVVSLISFTLIVPILWSIDMENVTSPILLYSGIISFLIGEEAMALSFWPLVPTIWSLSLSTILYIFMGIIIEYLKDKLSKKIIYEFSAFGVIVFIICFFVTSWSG